MKGFRNSPYGERRIGALTAIKARAPVLGGNFGVWGGLFSTFDCAVKGVRRKEDPYNASEWISMSESAKVGSYEENIYLRDGREKLRDEQKETVDERRNTSCFDRRGRMLMYI